MSVNIIGILSNVQNLSVMSKTNLSNEKKRKEKRNMLLIYLPVSCLSLHQ